MNAYQDKTTQESIQRSIAQFHSELPQLLSQHEDKWVAYTDGTRLEFVEDDRVVLLRKCYANGIEDQNLFVAKVQPKDEEEVYVDWNC